VPRKNIAAIVTVYRHNSHADVIVSRLLQTDTLDGKGMNSPLKLVSLYTDQRPPDDMSRLLSASHRFRISETIEDALTLGTGRLAVEGVLLVAEHGEYPKSSARKFEEARGLLINDYQNEMENQWIADLKKKYPVVINESVFKNLPK
jgi:hypothetical protein